MHFLEFNRRKIAIKYEFEAQKVKQFFFSLMLATPSYSHQCMVIPSPWRYDCCTGCRHVRSNITLQIIRHTSVDVTSYEGKAQQEKTGQGIEP